jgi:hypothetical protein
MNNILPLKKYSSIFLKIFLLLVLAGYFPLTGSDCNGNNIIGGSPGEIYGSWSLTEITGYLQDVCEGEQVTFDTTGIATLRCPKSNPITRSFTVSNDVLTYTETGVQYDITTLTTNTLVLSGRNVGRTLTYTKIPADAFSKSNTGNINGGNNSSELRKVNQKGIGE